MSFSQTIEVTNNLNNSYINLSNSIRDNITKLNSETQSKVYNIFNFASEIKDSLIENSTQVILNSVFRVNIYIRYAKLYTTVFNSWARRIYDLANLSAECANVTDYKVYDSLDNGVKKLMRGSPTNSACQFTLLEDLGQSPSTTFDPVTRKITTEIILKSLDLGSLSLPYSEEDEQTIKSFISGIAGLDTGIITNIKMLNINDNDTQVVEILFDPSFANTIPGTYSLPVKSNYSMFQPKSAEITVRLVDANIVLPSKFSGDFNISYLQDITKFSNVFK
jgi:hypothetical protein